MKKISCGLVVLLVCIAISLVGQDCLLNLTSPINYQTKLSGSYGEPRTQHFHAGIDFKQKRGIPRDSIFAIADGFISRISIQPDGYGNALYIDHACNKTSVYAHLHDFAPEIRSHADYLLYKNRKYRINEYLQAGLLPVRKGQFIGILGNTGRSSGPHLHFEIRNSNSETPINPAIFDLKPEDNIPPVIGGIMLYSIGPSGEELEKLFIPAAKQGDHYALKESTVLTSALRVGIGVRTFDQMNGASNHNGIYSLEMIVDGRPAFFFKLDSIPFSLSSFIHSHMDYAEKINNRYVSKCFKNPGNKLDLYTISENDGTIYPFEFKETQIVIIARDIEGNSSSIQFGIRRSDDFGIFKPTTIKDRLTRIEPSDSIAYSWENSQLVFLPGTFCQPVYLNLPISPSPDIDLRQQEPLPVFRPIKLSKTLIHRKHPRYQYTFAQTDEDGQIKRLRSRWENDSLLVTYVNELARYYLNVDTIPPSIRFLNLPGPKSKRCVIEITDNLIPTNSSEDISFDIFLDGAWQLARHDAKNNRVWFDMPPDRSGMKHDLVVTATDASYNRSELTEAFQY